MMGDIQLSKKLLVAFAVLVIAVGAAVGAYATNLGKTTTDTSSNPETKSQSCIAGSCAVQFDPTSTSNNSTTTTNSQSSPVETVPLANSPQFNQPSGQVSVQDIYIHANSDGTYDKNTITVSKDVPVKLHFTADSNAGCGRQLVVYGLDIALVSISGEEQVAEFTPTSTGTYDYSCGMYMWEPGKLIVN